MNISLPLAWCLCAGTHHQNDAGYLTALKGSHHLCGSGLVKPAVCCCRWPWILHHIAKEYRDSAEEVDTCVLAVNILQVLQPGWRQRHPRDRAEQADMLKHGSLQRVA